MFVEVVASAELGDIPSQAKRVPKRHGSQIRCGSSANCWRHREKYPAESSKTMKVKGFRYTGGYCLSNKACTQLSMRENFFSFWRPERGIGRDNVEKAFFALMRSSV